MYIGFIQSQFGAYVFINLLGGILRYQQNGWIAGDPHQPKDQHGEDEQSANRLEQTDDDKSFHGGRLAEGGLQTKLCRAGLNPCLRINGFFRTLKFDAPNMLFSEQR